MSDLRNLGVDPPDKINPKFWIEAIRTALYCSDCDGKQRTLMNAANHLEAYIASRCNGVAMKTPPAAAGASAEDKPVAWMHTVVQDDGHEDSALSFDKDSFPFQGVGGFRSVKVRPLVYGDESPSHTQIGEERAAQDDPRAKILSDIEELSSRFDWRMSPDKHGNHSIGHEELQRLLLDLKHLHKAVGQLPVVAPPSPEDDALRQQLGDMKRRAQRAHQVCNDLRLAYPEISELGDEGVLHNAIHDILRVDTPEADDATVRDAARYRWLRARYSSVNFGREEDDTPELCFEIPKESAVSVNLDDTLDRMMLVASTIQPNLKVPGAGE